MFTEKQLLKIFTSTNVPALVLSADAPTFSILEVTDSFLKVTGEEREFIITQSFFKLFSTEISIFPNRLQQSIQSAFKTKNSTIIEAVDFVFREGTSNPIAYFFCDLECIPVVEELNDESIPQPVFSIIITLSNITSYKKENDKINIASGQEEKEFLFGTWDYDTKTNLYTCSDTIYKIYGVEPDSFIPTMEAIQRFTHPNDLEKRNRIINYAIANKTNYYLAYRIIRWDKQIHNIVSLGLPKLDLNGNLIGFEGMLHVVSSNIQIERKLFETIFDLHKKTKLIETLIENLPVGIAVSKISTGELTIINKAFEKVCGTNGTKLKDLNSFFGKLLTYKKERNEVSENLKKDFNIKNDEILNWHEEVIRIETGEQKTINSKHIPIHEYDILITTAIDITEKDHLLTEFKIAIDRHNLVSIATDDAVFDWDIEKDVIFWKNSILTEALGYKEGMERDNLTQWLSGIHKDDLDEFQKSLSQFLGDKEVSNWIPEHYRIVKADGTYAYIKGLAYVIRNSKGIAIRMVGVLRDVTKRKEEVLRLNLLESVVENMGDAVIITEAHPLDTPGPQMIYANPAFYELTGYSPNEILGKSPRILQGELSDRDALIKLKESLKARIPFKLSTVNYKKNGEPVWINGHINPIFDEKGKCVNWIGVQRDVTEEKKAEIRLQELNKNLLDQTQKLELSNKELEQFAYIASHDLQEPLKMITSFLQLLERKYENQLDDRARQYIQFAVDGSLRLRQTIMELLDYSRVGKAGDKVELINLNELVNEVEQTLSDVINEKNALIESCKLPNVWAKKTPIRQVFQNLIGNALKYSRKEEPPHVRIFLEERLDSWLFCVQDNGMGIAKEHHEKIFIIFQRLHAKKDIPGTGLGLAITKKAIESMKGKIWLESEVGNGSRFFFSIAKGFNN